MSDTPAIVVRRAEVRDGSAIATTFAASRAYAGTLQLPFPSASMWEKRIAEISADDFLLVAEADGEVVGNCGLQPASRSPRRRHAGTIGMAVRDDWHGRGVGTALMKAAVDLADNWVGYSRLELTAYTDNAAALALYRKFGFAIEGTARGYALRDGVLVDAYMMARHAPVD
ncbi:MAG TPA: GNAT family N-acetyltransferase [Casimicrobiaceae bacterium]|jgi:putative acetyltransferase|nr:GNAT family N-acetyltransferase [Casimicrobiaceae bacterium]